MDQESAAENGCGATGNVKNGGTVAGRGAAQMLFSDSVISPTKNVVEFGDDQFLIEAVYDDEELRRLVPHVDEMLGDIMATWRCREQAAKLGEDYPEWDDPYRSEARDYAKVARDHLIDAGCIFAEHDQHEEIVYFTGLADVLKRCFDFCVESADDSEAVLKIVRHSPASGQSPNRTGASTDR